MKKLIKYLVPLGLIITIALFALYIYSYAAIEQKLQSYYIELSYYFASPTFPFYIKLIVFFIAIILILFLYNNSLVLKKEINYRHQLEKEAHEKSERLEQSLALSKATLEATADGILVVDKDRRIVGYNQKLKEMWHVPDHILAPGNDEEAAKFVVNQVKDPEEFVKNLELFYNLEPGKEIIGLVEFKDGRIFERYTMPQMQGDEIIGRVFSFRDVTQRKAMEEQLTHQATHDSLTALPNRVILLDRINQELKSSKRSRTIGAVLFFDLDQFKLVNDGLGHEIGDILLQSVARRLEHCIREHDTVARWGGDEFVILLTALKDENEAIPIAVKCLKVLEETFVIDKHTLSITCSVGISFLPKDGANTMTLLKNADSAMYHAKNEGRNNYKVYTETMGAYTKKQLELTNELHEAVKDDQFTIYYQPLIDLQDGSIRGAEALLRWNHPTLGFISPQDFIPVAEDTGLILSIGEWVLRTASLQNKTWQEKGLPPITMAVNLSGRQFKQKNIPEIVANILKETKIDPQYLELELTESVIMENTQAFLEYMHELKKMGVKLVIDDFGTGYSSLSYLKRFPVDTLKIDLSFIAGIPGSKDDTAIVRAILAMAKQLHLDVVAEGIENEKQLSFLTDNFCQKGQGFLFSKAVPPDEFTKLLKKNNFKTFFEQKNGKKISIVKDSIHPPLVIS